ncbi:MAG: response regulator [Armatimonadota bacterium]
MSYPRNMQVLVIEDDQSVKQYYETLFQRLKEEHEVASVRYAFSYSEAAEALAQNTMFHLVILDLRLPEEPGIPAPDETDNGLALLRICEERDDYPVPALLIISGHPDMMDQTQLQDEIAKSFWYGRVIIKGPDLDEYIHASIQKVQAYCDIGVHVRDGGSDKYPTLTPREEDLLRRCVLHQESAIGLDLRWWSDEYDKSSGWTKTLMGHFVLENGMGLSRPTFFKFFPAVGAEHVLRATRIMEQKLDHIKVLGDKISGGRSLLVTQKVGSSSADPIQFKDILREPHSNIKEQIPDLIRDVAEQVAALGDETPDQQPIKNLICNFLVSDELKEQWQIWGARFSLNQDDPTLDPVQTRFILTENTNILRIRIQGCHHGDLNLTNIAVDRIGSKLKAHIFDAGSCTAHVNVRDLAMLEITGLLHQSLDGNDSLVQECCGAYEGGVDLPVNIANTATSDVARNTLHMIREIRAEALKRTTGEIYALMVFDIAVMQLWGLAYTVSRNKIKNPADAAILATYVSAWLRRIAPIFFNATELC